MDQPIHSTEVELLLFPIVKNVVHNPFQMGENLSVTKRQITYVSWRDTKSKTPIELTTMLHQEVINYILNNNILVGYCNKSGDKLFTLVKDESGEDVLKSYIKDEDLCKRHTSNLYQESIFDVISRDEDAFSDRIGVDLYVIVMIYNGEYYGHIYVWKNDINPPMTQSQTITPNYACFAIGIRSRIDLLFLRKTYDNIPSRVSDYLLEGVKYFAIMNDCRAIVVPYPLKNMMVILEKNGFTRVSLTHREAGPGPGIVGRVSIFNPKSFNPNIVISNAFMIATNRLDTKHLLPISLYPVK